MQKAIIEKRIDTVNTGTGYALFPFDILKNVSLSAKAKVIFGYLLCFYNRRKGYAYPSKNKIMKDLNISKRLLDESLLQLIANGYMEKSQSHKENGDWDVNHYDINMQLINEQLKNGYGIVAKDVITDAKISIQAKALYLAMAVFSRANYETTIHSSRLSKILKSTRTTINKNRAELVQNNIISIEDAGQAGLKYTILIRPTRTVVKGSKNEPTPNESTSKQPAPHEPAPNESTNISTVKNSNSNKKQVIINTSEEEDEAFEEHIIDFMVDVGTLPSSLLAKQQERDVAIRLLLPYQLGGEKPSVGYTLCCDALSGMLAPGHVTIVRGRSVTSDDVLEKVQERIVCDTSTDWVPQLMLSDLIAKIDVAIEAEEIVSPLNYAEICIAQFLFYSRI